LLTSHCSLLETGSSQLIRNTAAEQLADVQKQHPDELFNLLTKVIPFLRSKSWDTRAAAAKAIGGIVDHAEKYDPNEDEGDVKSETNGHATNGTTDVKVEDLSINDDQLQLETLDVESILKKGKPLLGSAGKEYDYQFVGMDPTQRLAYQKKTLTARLGLGISSDDVDAEMGDLITSKDVDTPMYPMPPPGGISKLDTNVSRHNSISSPGVSTPMEINGDENGGLSKRQLNMLKRKNKQRLKSEANKVRIVDFSERKSSMADPDTPAVPHAVKLEVKKEESENGVNDYFSLDRKGADDDSQLVKEFKGMPVPEKSAFATEAEEDGSEWPFERLMEFLTVDLFDHAWEIRHGAAQGIREVIRAHGAGAGRLRGKTRAQNNLLNKRWLEDLAARLCCVFMLDRFGDYISDNVTVPVRENAGQALGAVLQHLPASSVKAIFGVLRRLLPLDKTASMWQPCHGGILGMRYLVAVRNDLLIDEPDLLDGVLEAVMRCLSDEDDDVRAVSAATLIPIAKEIVTTRPQILNQLIIEVWNCLSNLSDDLSASTGFVMDLLATLCSYQEVLEAMKANAAQDPELSFANLVPRLFPFLRHTISTVRSAVLRALLTFLNIKGAGTEGWINGKALRLVFQNLLVERELNVVRLSLQVWDGLVESLVSQNPDTFAAEFSPHIVPLLTLVMHPIGVPRHNLPMDATLFMRPSGQTYSLPTNGAARKASPQAGMEPPKKRRRSDKKEKDAIPSSNISHNIDAPMIQGEVELVGTETLIRSKLFAAQALGKAMASWPVASRLDAFGPHVIPYFASTFSTTQMTVGIVVEEYAKATTEKDELCLRFAAGLKPIAEGDRPVAYGDLTSYLHIVRAQCQSLINTFRDQGHVAQGKLPTMPVLVQGDPSASQFAFSITDAEKIVDADFERLKKGLSPAQRVTSTQQLLATQSDVKKAINEANTAKEQRDIRIKAAAAAAIVALDEVDYKRPSLTIKGMMDSVKNEENIELQRRSAFAVADLIKRMSLVGKQAVINKVAGNLCKFYCKETAETPEFWPNTGLVDGILSLNKDEDIKEVQDQVKYDREAKEARIMRRGAKEALERLVMDFGAKLFDKVPVLKSMIEKPVHAGFDADELPSDITEPDQSSLGQEIIDALSILRALVPKLHSGLHAFVIELMPLICKALRTRLGVLRYVAAKCFATICSVMNVSGFTMLVEKVLPSINNAIDVRCRQGAIECIYHLIHVMQEGILPYVVFLVVPTLGRMSDSNDDVRRIATTTFAHLVKLMPLEAGIEDPPGLSQDLLKGRERERKFITQMLDPKKVEDFPIPVSINAELRPYQQDGVNWLAFLNRYNLHGILCDDMGLGKTLQTLCMVASDHYNRAQEYRKTQAPEKRPLPSLIVCPPSLSGHWQQEIRTYAPFLKFVAFVGPSGERARKRSQLADTDIVITSYEVCRNEIDTLGTLDFNYCVLDEGHLIKNPKAKTTIAVKEVKAEHRLILSGTPIQNNVLELWSLFDFLMPGFLGSEKVFKDRFAKPIAASRGAKSSSKEQEAGALAIEALHKQVLPFLLRRLKEEVLNDLPPKILQNYYCDLSDLQRKLFQDFIKKEGDNVKSLAGSADTAGKQHIFQALQYMRKLCNSPAMVFKESHPQYEALKAQLAKEKTTLRDPIHAPKLGALRDLLVDCGIGAEDVDKTDKEKKENGPSQMPEPAVSQHRALIFCQMKEMLDMVQTEVLQKMLPSVQSLRLDGSVEAGKRQDIVNRFNSDPSYDVLLLTTSVGGLGLNLTGADTVIFVEHDWNPQKDMQAMDRAHRIGQKKVVNVYRIVTRGTLEEKILKYALPTF
jgi:TATA-binding protein-associated factor